MLTEEEKSRYAGAVGVRKLDDDQRVLVLYPLLFGAFRLCVGPLDDEGCDDIWEYPAEEYETAMSALLDWDGTGDAPVGWHRAQARGERNFRRRPDGDPEKEFSAP